MNKRFAYFMIFLAMIVTLSACAPKAKGIIVETVMPAQIDITSEAALEGDSLMQAIIVDRIRQPGGKIYKNKTISFYVRSALKDALNQTHVFNIRGPGSHMSAPRIRPVVERFYVAKDVVADGYVTRRGVAAINFSLTSSSGNKVGSTTETAEIVNRQPIGAQLRPRADIMKEMATDICQDFVKKIVPTPKKEFRQFASGNTTVNNGVKAAMNRDWDLAIDLWKDVVASNPKNAPATYNLGIAYEAKKMLRRALKQYKAARKLDTGNSLYQRTYAKLKRKLKTSKKIDNIKDEIREESMDASD